MQKLWIVVLAVALAGCNGETLTDIVAGRYNTVPGTMTMNNKSGHTVQTYIEGQPVGPVIPPGPPVTFDYQVKVPVRNNSGGNSSYDQWEPVNVVIYDITAAKSSDQTTCQGGARVYSNVQYDWNQYSNYGNISCQTSFKSDKLPSDSAHARLAP